MNEASTVKQQFWLDHIEAADSSGLSIAQYAKQHDIGKPAGNNRVAPSQCSAIFKSKRSF